MHSSDHPPAGKSVPQEGSTSSGESVPSPNARIIKRYSNRKLYDTVESRYVTLPQIAALVRKGEDVRIIDNNSKEDLTSVTLAQILYEEERKQSRALPLAALKDLIHASGEKIISTLREGPVGKFIGSRGAEASTEGTSVPTGVPEASTSSTSTEGSSGAPSTPRESSTSKLYEMFEQSKVSVQEWQHQVDQRVRKVLEGLSPTSQIEKLQAEVRRLAQRVEELERRLGISSRSEGGEE